MLHLLVTRLFLAIGRWHQRRKTIHELSRLNDHLLRDVGIHRHEIEAVVHRSVRSLPAWREPRGRAVVLPNGTLIEMAPSCCTAPGRG